MSQLTLFTAPVAAPKPGREPDNRHPWGLRTLMRGGPDEWRCDVCGELATICEFTGKWLFLRPQLAKPPRGPWHFDQVSHACEPRDWQ